jgi:hypothetical protein
MDLQKFGETILMLIAQVIPVLLVVAMWMAYSYQAKRKKEVSKDEEKVYEALDKLWPLITTDSTAQMITQQPAAYFVVSKLMAERQAAKTFKEIK